MNTDAERYQFLRDVKCNSFTLSRDDLHNPNYMTAAEFIATEPKMFSRVPPDELERMRATNTIWGLQIYPNTPIGFNVYFGASMEAVIDLAMAEQELTA